MLLAAVDEGGLSAGARAMKVPVSTLTRKVGDLEELLGTRLLVRTTRKLTLTDAGATYAASARRILEQVSELEREAAGEFRAPCGELVIATPVQFGRLHVLPVINDFLALFPDITVRLLQSDRNVDLLDAQADLAVRVGRLPDSSLVAVKVGALRAVMCASPSFLARHGEPWHPGELAGLPCVVFNSPYLSPWRFRMPDSHEACTFIANPRLEVSAPDSACDACVAGLGATMLLEHDVAQAVSDGQLRIILRAFETEPVPVHLVYVSRSLMPLKLRRFLDFAAPRLRESLAHFGHWPAV